MKEGLEMEDNIIAAYKVCKQQQGVTGITVEKCGFYISKHNGFLGASPDGLVHDPSTENSEGLIELKYIQVEEHESLEDALIRKIWNMRMVWSSMWSTNIIFKYNKLCLLLKENGLTLWLWDRLCHNILWESFFSLKTFWNTIFPKARVIFNCWIVPELAYPCVKYGIPKNKCLHVWKSRFIHMLLKTVTKVFIGLNEVQS